MSRVTAATFFSTEGTKGNACIFQQVGKRLAGFSVAWVICRGATGEQAVLVLRCKRGDVQVPGPFHTIFAKTIPGIAVVLQAVKRRLEEPGDPSAGYIKSRTALMTSMISMPRGQFTPQALQVTQLQTA